MSFVLICLLVMKVIKQHKVELRADDLWLGQCSLKEKNTQQNQFVKAKSWVLLLEFDIYSGFFARNLFSTRINKLKIHYQAEVFVFFATTLMKGNKINK